MKCTECPDYTECSRKSDLRRKRHTCPKAKEQKGADMTLAKALNMVEKEYERAKNLQYVRNPLAYALHKVWKEADRQPAEIDFDYSAED